MEVTLDRPFDEKRPHDEEFVGICDNEDVDTFAGLGVNDELLRGIYAYGFEKPAGAVNFYQYKEGRTSQIASSGSQKYLDEFFEVWNAGQLTLPHKRRELKNKLKNVEDSFYKRCMQELIEILEQPELIEILEQPKHTPRTENCRRRDRRTKGSIRNRERR